MNKDKLEKLIVAALEGIATKPELEALYTEFHRNPEARREFDEQAEMIAALSVVDSRSSVDVDEVVASMKKKETPPKHDSVLESLKTLLEGVVGSWSRAEKEKLALAFEASGHLTYFAAFQEAAARVFLPSDGTTGPSPTSVQQRGGPDLLRRWLIGGGVAAAAASAFGGWSVGSWEKSAIAATLERRESELADVTRWLTDLGLHQPVKVDIEPSGEQIVIRCSYDARFVSSVKARANGAELSTKTSPTEVPNHTGLSVIFDASTIGDWQEFNVEVEFTPKERLKADEVIGAFFSNSRMKHSKRFANTPVGLVVNPDSRELKFVGKLEHIAWMPDAMDPKFKKNGMVEENPTRYSVTGFVGPQAYGKYGWLIIDPERSDDMFVGSTLPVIESGENPRFNARCYLGLMNNSEPFRIYCVFSDQKDALNVLDRIPRNYSWKRNGFVKSESKFKTNNAKDGFVPDPSQ